jgi:hypothetical protein
MLGRISKAVSSNVTVPEIDPVVCADAADAARRTKPDVAAMKERSGTSSVSVILPARPQTCQRCVVRNVVTARVPERVAMRLTGYDAERVRQYDIVSNGDLRDAAGRRDGVGDRKSDHIGQVETS